MRVALKMWVPVGLVVMTFLGYKQTDRQAKFIDCSAYAEIQGY